MLIPKNHELPTTDLSSTLGGEIRNITKGRVANHYIFNSANIGDLENLLDVLGFSQIVVKGDKSTHVDTDYYDTKQRQLSVCHNRLRSRVYTNNIDGVETKFNAADIKTTHPITDNQLKSRFEEYQDTGIYMPANSIYTGESGIDPLSDKRLLFGPLLQPIMNTQYNRKTFISSDGLDTKVTIDYQLELTDFITSTEIDLHKLIIVEVKSNIGESNLDRDIQNNLGMLPDSHLSKGNLILAAVEPQLLTREISQHLNKILNKND